MYTHTNTHGDTHACTHTHAHNLAHTGIDTVKYTSLSRITHMYNKSYTCIHT